MGFLFLKNARGMPSLPFTLFSFYYNLLANHPIKKVSSFTEISYNARDFVLLSLLLVVLKFGKELRQSPTFPGGIHEQKKQTFQPRPRWRPLSPGLGCFVWRGVLNWLAPGIGRYEGVPNPLCHGNRDRRAFAEQEGCGSILFRWFEETGFFERFPKPCGERTTSPKSCGNPHKRDLWWARWRTNNYIPLATDN